MPEVADIPKILGNGKIEAVKLESMANGIAAATPLPGPVAPAFLSGPIKVGDYEVREFVAADWIIMQAIDSPLNRMWLENQKPEENQEKIEYSEQEECLIPWQFTTPVREAYEMSKTMRSDEIMKIAADKFLFGSCADTPLLVMAASEQFQRHVKTRLEHATQLKDSGQVSFFQKLTG